MRPTEASKAQKKKKKKNSEDRSRAIGLRVSDIGSLSESAQPLPDNERVTKDSSCNEIASCMKL